MNIKNFVVASMVGSVFIFVYEFLVHGVLMAGVYESTSHLWRSMEAMNSMMGISIAIQVATAMVVVCLVKHWHVHGASRGAQFGLGLGVLLAIMQIGTYVYLPIPFSLALMWSAAVLVKMTGVGAIAGWLYKK